MCVFGLAILAVFHAMVQIIRIVLPAKVKHITNLWKPKNVLVYVLKIIIFKKKKMKVNNMKNVLNVSKEIA